MTARREVPGNRSPLARGTATTVLGILRDSRELLDRPGVWIQGEEAVDWLGRPTDNWDTDACRLSLAGALSRSGARDGVLARCHAIVAVRETAGCFNLQQWNDEAERKLQDILDVLDRTIRRERQHRETDGG